MKTQLIFFLLLIQVPAFSQDSIQTIPITIHPVVGTVIDSSEKVRYRILTYYRSENFDSASIRRTQDGTLIMEVQIKDSALLYRKITFSELKQIRDLITYVSGVPAPITNIPMEEGGPVQPKKRTKGFGWVIGGAAIIIVVTMIVSVRGI